MPRTLDALRGKGTNRLFQTIWRSGNQVNLRALQPESARHRETKTGTTAGHERALSAQIEKMREPGHDDTIVADAACADEIAATIWSQSPEVRPSGRRMSQSVSRIDCVRLASGDPGNADQWRGALVYPSASAMPNHLT